MPNPEPQTLPRSNQHQVNINLPDAFDFEKPETWPMWEKRFLRFISVANLLWKTDKQKTDLLCYTMGGESEEILLRILPNVKCESFEDVLKAFRGYFTPRTNVIIQRVGFNSRVQLTGESVDSFITALYSLAEKCDYGTAKEDLIRDRIVVGIRDDKTSESLQSKPDLTLAAAITEVKLAESRAKELGSITASIKKKHSNSKAIKESGSNKGKCCRCGLWHPQGVPCPAEKSTCRKCNEYGHWDKVCKANKVHNVAQDTNSLVDDKEDKFCMGSISRGPVQSLAAATSTDLAHILNIDDIGLQAVTENSEIFTNNCFRILVKNNPGNLITSPLSVQILLAMTAYGAGGWTATEMHSALQLPKDDRLGQYGYRSLIRTMNAEKGVELSVATKIFIASGVTVKPEYQQLTDKKFLSVIQNVDFKDPRATASAINTWCEKQTKKRITKVVEPGSFRRDTVCVLVNALYFKGQWESPFQRYQTEYRPFYIDEITTKLVPIMTNMDKFRTGDLPQLDAKFIEMPYKGGRLSMIIILPNSKMGLKKVLNNLHHVNLRESLQKTVPEYVDVYVPKFKIMSTFNLKPTLETLGMSRMFQAVADFSKITDVPINVTQAVQTAFIEVIESGAEEATVISWREGRRINPSIFTVDHPFYFSIYHRQTGISFFSGVVKTPVSA